MHRYQRDNRIIRQREGVCERTAFDQINTIEIISHTQKWDASVVCARLCVFERDKCWLPQWWLNWWSRTLNKWMWLNHNNYTINRNKLLWNAWLKITINITNQKCYQKCTELLSSEIGTCNEIVNEIKLNHNYLQYLMKKDPK